jgi:CRP-like cAMP-binding protein
MALVLNGRLEAVIGTKDSIHTLQIIPPGAICGELGLLSRGVHSRTIRAAETSKVK